MENVKGLESNLYDEPSVLYDNPGAPELTRKSILGRGSSALGNHVTKPSTHASFYFAGIGWAVGVAGGILWGIKNSLYSDGPEILTKLYTGAWKEAGYLALYAVAKSALTTAYVSGVGGGIGYIGGSIIAERVWGSVTSLFNSIISFFSFKKRRG